jgi:predicted RNase H-like HicB family nuclease
MPETPTPTLHVIYAQDPDQGCWTAQVAEARQFITQGDTLEKAYLGIRGLLQAFGGELADAQLTGCTDWSHRQDLTPDLVEAAREPADQRLVLLEQRHRLKRTTARAARHMVNDRELTYRRAGQLLGLTHQRVQQIVTGGEELTP